MLVALLRPPLELVAETAPSRTVGSSVPQADRPIVMDFHDVDIAVLVKFISEVTGTRFIVDERVRGKISIVSPTAMSVADAYATFQSALNMHGFTTVPAGAAIKIVPTTDAKHAPIDTVAPDER